jgi:hypothetical protein
MFFSSVAEASSFLSFMGFFVAGYYFQNQSSLCSSSADNHVQNGDKDMATAADYENQAAVLILNWNYLGSLGQETYKSDLAKADYSRKSAINNYSDAGTDKANSNTYATLSSASYVVAGYYLIKTIYEKSTENHPKKIAKQNSSWHFASKMANNCIQLSLNRRF